MRVFTCATIGCSLLMARNVTEASEIEASLIVVEKWFDEVRKKVD